MDDPSLDPNNPNGADGVGNGAGTDPVAVNSSPNTQAGGPTPVVAVLPTLGRFVHVNFPDGFDGATEAAGIVASVHGDGSLNVFVFPPNGGAAFSLAGTRSVDERNALPSDSADRNLPAWYWPPGQ